MTHNKTHRMKSLPKLSSKATDIIKIFKQILLHLKKSCYIQKKVLKSCVHFILLRYRFPLMPINMNMLSGNRCTINSNTLEYFQHLKKKLKVSKFKVLIQIHFYIQETKKYHLVFPFKLSLQMLGSVSNIPNIKNRMLYVKKFKINSFLAITYWAPNAIS